MDAKGSINAFFDTQGKIEMAYEYFQIVLLPRPIQNELFQKHQGWTMLNNSYRCTYEGEDLINHSFKIELVKGDHKKSVVIRK